MSLSSLSRSLDLGVVAGTYSNIIVVVGAVLTGLYKVIAAANIRNL